MAFKNNEKDDEYVIALTPTCPSIGKEPSDELQKLVDDGLGDIIYDYAKTHPFIIKDYKEGFPVLMVRSNTFNLKNVKKS